MNNQLVKFESACQAVADAKTFYDAMTIRDKAEALRAYGKIAKDRTIETDGIELRLRAERRLGEMMEQAPKAQGTAGTGDKNVGKATGGVRAAPPVKVPNLASQGIDKHLAKRARTLARIPQAEFERHIEEKREAIDKTDAKIIKSVTSKKTKGEIRDAHKQRFDSRVKHFLEKTKAYAREIEDTITCRDKFSSEAKAFAIRQLESLERKIENLKETLS